MRFSTPAIICGVRLHGEHGAIVRALTPEHGLMAGYVRGSRSRTMRPALIPSNEISAQFAARTADQLPGLTVDLVHSRGMLMREPLASAALDWITALTATSLPEAHPYPMLFAALDGVIRAIEAAPSARRWVSALVQYERLILEQAGYAQTLSAMPIDDWNTILAALKSTRRRLELDVLTGHKSDILAARDRLVERLEKAQ